jgi:hypothetical protein
MRRAATALTLEGLPVRHLRSTCLPEDELCFHLFEASADALVVEVGARAGAALERVVEAVDDTAGIRERSLR